MKTILVNTKRFIEEMGDPGFLRIDYHTGQNGNTEFATMYPPEQNKNFLDNLFQGIKENLS